MMSALDDWLSSFGLGDEPYEPIWIGDAGARELRGLLRELAELRALHSRTLTVFGVWPEAGGETPERVCATDDGDDTGLDLDAAPLLEQARKRWARALCRQYEEGEGPPLELLLGLVPGGAELTAGAPIVRDGWEARWELYTEYDEGRGEVEIGTAINSSLPAAIRAATLELLGLDLGSAGPQLSGSPARVVRAAMAWADVVADRASTGNGAWTWTAAEAGLLMAVEELRQGAGEPRRTCSTCEHWQREGEPATSEGARLCRLRPDVAARTAASSCDRWEPLPEQIGAGVTQLANVVRAEPEGDR